MTIDLRLAFHLDDAPTDAWDFAYAYLDEQHPTPEDPSFGVVVLLVPDAIDSSLVTDALAKLPRSSTARRRGWFHAKDDGRDAQRVLADALGAHIRAAQVHLYRWDSRRANGRPGPQSAEELHMHVASL